MKKLVATVLAVVTAVSMTACGSKVAENTVHSVDDLPGKTIGVQLGTTGDIYASDYEAEGSTIERYNKGNDAVQALKQGKLDCVIIDEQPAKAFVEKNDDLTILDEEFTLEEYAICVAKENPDLTASINEVLASMKADGTLDKIISNYIGDDTKGKFPLELDENAEYPNGKLVMATNAAFEPYEFYEGEEIVGIDVDMARMVAAQLGMELQIEDMEFDSIITAVQSGKADIGVAGMTVTEDRLKNIDFTDPYTTAKQVIIVRK
ncbi:MAG: transporter substrate-binding domain-containing protein [Lachnospiraceae bacterium]